MRQVPNPRYYNLLQLTVQELMSQFPEIIPPDKRVDEVVDQAERYGFAVPFVEAYSYLHTLGYIVNEYNQNNVPNPAGIRITERGLSWIKDESDPIPEDEAGYFSTLKLLVPDIDPIISQYVEEAVRAYGRQMPFAAAVMIGAASEKCLYALMDALASAITDKHEKSTVKNAIGSRGLPTMFNLLQKNLTGAKKSIPWDVYEGVDCHLLSFQEAIRIQRNDAVHPNVGRVSPEQVRLMLTCFPTAYRKLSDLTAWLAQNKI